MKIHRYCIAVLLLTGLALTGCPVVSYITMQLTPPKKIDALYHLPKDCRLLVLVENRTYLGNFEAVRRDITYFLNKELLARGLVREVVSYNELMTLRMSEPQFNRMATSVIGKKLNADAILYVHIDKCILRDNPGAPWHGRLETTVRVVKAGVTGRRKARMWPDSPPDGYALEPVERDPVTDSSPTYAARLAKVLSIEMANRIAKLFYDHRLKGPDSGSGKVTEDTERALQ